MGGDVIQANYDHLVAISVRLRSQAEQCDDLEHQLRRSLHPLQDGGWQGCGASAFFDEVEVVILPGLARLRAVLADSEAVTREVSAQLQAAEQAAAQLFRSNGAGPGASAIGGASRTVTATPVRTSSDVFSDAYLSKLVGMHFQGAGSPQLNQAMETLQSNPSPEQVSQALDQIAEARRLPRHEVQAQYARYLELREQAAQYNAQRAASLGQQPKPIEHINQQLNGNFLGSQSSLRYGKVVGDVLGLDPVFGSLLNPTGGLIGPGNYALDWEDSPLSHHGIVHDAAGYLYNYHGIGPGYNYLGREPFDPGNPLTGQLSGISYWHGKFVTDKTMQVVTETTSTLHGVVQDGQEFLEGVSRGVRDSIKDLFSF